MPRNYSPAVFDGQRTRFLVSEGFYFTDGKLQLWGTGSPEGVVTAQPGSLYIDENTSPTVAYLKRTGIGNTGWDEFLMDNEENLWDRTGTVLSPHTPTDTLSLTNGTSSVPAIAFGGSPDTGFFSPNKDQLSLILDAAIEYRFTNTYTQFGSSGGFPRIMIEVATSTNPVFLPEGDDPDTGIGRAGADQLSLIAGGVEGIRVNTASAHSVAGIANYETLVIADDDIPNKKYVDDLVGGNTLSVTSTAIAYLLLLTDDIVKFTGAGGVNLTLYTAVGNTGEHFWVDNASTGNITIVPNGAEASEVVTVLPNQKYHLYSDNVGWRIL